MSSSIINMTGIQELVCSTFSDRANLVSLIKNNCDSAAKNARSMGMERQQTRKGMIL